jgi:hypothetical protein
MVPPLKWFELSNRTFPSILDNMGGTRRVEEDP